jgi:hypothetical protein
MIIYFNDFILLFKPKTIYIYIFYSFTSIFDLIIINIKKNNLKKNTKKIIWGCIFPLFIKGKYKAENKKYSLFKIKFLTKKKQRKN